MKTERKRRHILLTGKPGCGKTTIIKRVIQDRRDVAGFYTAEIKEGSRRTGFAIHTIDGKEGILASVDIDSPIRVGRYFVNLKDIGEIAIPSVEKAIKDPSVRFVVIDEIASMEMSSPRFSQAVIQALNSEKRVIGTIQDKRNPFLDEIRARNDVTVIRVELAKRESILELLEGLLK